MGWMNDFIAVDQANGPKLTLESNVKGASIGYGTDGTDPKSGTYKGPIVFKGEVTLKAKADNPGGVMKPVTVAQRYIDRLPACDIKPETLNPGILWWAYKNRPTMETTLLELYPFISGTAVASDISFNSYSFVTGTSVDRYIGLNNNIDSSSKHVNQINKIIRDVAPVSTKYVRGAKPSVESYVRVEGYIKVPQDGLYDFAIYMSGRLYIDDIQIIDSAFLASAVWQDQVALKKGFHKIRLETYDIKRRLYWKGPEFSWHKIKDDEIYHVSPKYSKENAITREVYEDVKDVFSKEFFAKNVPNMKDNISSTSASPSLPNSIQRLRGYIVPPISGEYTFGIDKQPTDNAKLWLSVDENPRHKKLISESSPSAPVRLVKGKKYYIEVNHYSKTGKPVAATWHYLNEQGIKDGGVIIAQHLRPMEKLAVAPDPQAVFTSSIQFGPAPFSSTFDARGSTISHGKIASYQWNFGDGSTGTGALTQHRYGKNGTYKIVLTITSDEGKIVKTHRHLVVGKKGGINCGDRNNAFKSKEPTLFIEDTFQILGVQKNDPKQENIYYATSVSSTERRLHLGSGGNQAGSTIH